MEISNASQFPKMYYCRHMVQGVAGYKDENIFVDEECMKKMMPSFVGKPVYIYHQNVDLDSMKEDCVGYVTESFYNELDGWLWAKFLVIDDAAHEVIKKGWSVSNSYLPLPLGWTDGGTHLNIDYNRKITDAEFTHLAIVPDPRYETAKIFTPEEFKQYQDEKKNQLKELQNNKGVKKMLNFFKKTKIENPEDIKEGDILELDNGLVVTVNNSKKAKKNDDDTADYDLKALINEAVKSYMESNSKKNDDDSEDEDKKNSDDSEDKKKESNEDKKDNKKNSDEDEDKKDNSLESDNKDYFAELSNAHFKGVEEREVVVKSPRYGEALGSQKYGSK